MIPRGALSLYHRFNPSQEIPLNGLIRVLGHFSTYDANDDTAPSFAFPQTIPPSPPAPAFVRGGREPTLFPEPGDGDFGVGPGFWRSEDGSYGYPSDPRNLRPDSHLFWGEAFLAYTLPESRHRFELSLTVGTSLDADRFSAYRLGGLLPLASDPLSLPGYFYQEISARQFALLSGSYILPFDGRQRWNLALTAATAVVNYLPGLEQPGDWNTGLGAGLLYKTEVSKVMLGYGYGVDAIRTHGRGAQSIGIWMQFDLRKAKGSFFNPDHSGPWRGLKEFFGVFGG